MKKSLTLRKIITVLMFLLFTISFAEITSADVIIDNGDAATSSTGTWAVSGASGAYGTNSLYATTNGATYSWSFTPTTTGTYTVSMWWTAIPSRVTNAPVSITNAGTTANLIVDQNTNGGKWNTLGNYTFNAGTTYKVTITAPNLTPPSTCADAVSFTYIPPNIAPTAVIDSIVPNPAYTGQSVQFTGHGTDTDGTIAAYKWQSSIDGNLSDANSFSTSALSLGTHTISFTVQDNGGLWSTAATQTVTINSPPAEIIIDNGDAATSSTGTWQVSGIAGAYGTNSVWSYSGATYTWKFTPVTTGTYKLSMWWTASTSRSSSVPVSIQNSSGTAAANINQQQNGGQWNDVGQYAFNAGTTYNVTITAPTGSPPSTCADAVKFTFVSGNNPPTAIIDTITPNPATAGQVIQFTGHGTDTDGTIAAYKWQSNIDGNLSTSNSFTKNNLSTGTHTITFTVQDDKGTWSPAVTQSVAVESNNVPPTAQILSITPSPANVGQAVHFSGKGTDSDGTIQAYSWTSSIDGHLSDANSFTTSTLSQGVHTIIFEVQDNKGAWSTEVIQSLTVGTPPTEIIIDNGDAATSSTGTWQVSGATGAYGTNSLWSYSGATYTWTFTPTAGGSYKVSMWWTAATSRSSSVPVTIQNNAGTANATINQQQNGGQWNEIGQYQFDAGSSYAVKITAPAGSPPSTCADAVKFTLVNSNNAPIATIDSITPNPATSGQTVQFKGHGSDTDGTIAAYRWRSSIDGNLSDVNAFTKNNLSIGTHTITLEVQDNGGLWSQPMTQSLTIQAPPNIPPVASITSITPNPATQGQTVSFVGTGTDTDGTITAYKWQSNIDGNLSSLNSFTKSNLSLGTHTITLTVQDDDGVWSQPVTQTIVVQQAVNVPPTASITSITPNPVNAGQTISFVGTGTDTDGTIAEYRWTSSINGVISNQASFSKNTLSPGSHTISFKVKDNKGAWSTTVTRTLTVNVVSANIVSDNGGSGTSSTGSWVVSGASGPYGTNSVYSSGGATYTWSFTAPITGNYQVYLWWTALSTRNTSVPYAIQRNGGTTTVNVNQRSNGGKWNSAGTFAFTAGQTYTIKVTANGTSYNSCADAVRWQIGTASNPTAQITSINSSPAVAGQSVEFSGAGFDTDGIISAYEWKSSINGTIGTTSNFSTSSLSTGTHTISLRVLDNAGNWSTTVTQQLVVNANTAPTASITSITPNPALLGQTVSFAGTGTDTDGTISAYEWKSSINGTIGSTSSFTTSSLSAGTHTISFRVQDNSGTWSNTVTQQLNINTNAAPTASITSITPNPATQGQTISFVGTGTDSDGTISAYEWKSNISGTIGSTASFTTSSLSVGTHTISFRVQDNSGNWSAAVTQQLVISTPGNNPPTALIDSVTPSPATFGQTVQFTGHGTDTDGTIAAYKWQSSIDGNLSNASSFSTSSLSTGTHTISFTVRDNGGAWSTAVTRSLIVNSGISDTIIDNGASATSSTGTWAASGATGAYGTNSLYATTNGATYTWSFTPTTTGTYTVSMWWTALSSRITNAPVSITNAGTTANLTVDQTANGGQWNALGQYTFNAGTTYKVTITAPNLTPPSTCADAVKFTYGSSVNNPPTATISSITPNPSTLGQTISFAGSGTDTDGTITAYEWTSSISGVIGNSGSFTTSSLPVGTHTISFRVQDNLGTWSSPVTTSLVVNPNIPADIIIDDGSANCTSTGLWNVSGASGFYGSDALWSRDGATYTWRVTPVASANYEVFAWWSAYTSRSNAVPIDIVNAAGTNRVTVNQQTNGGQWNSLGIFPFQAGITYNITVTAVNGSSISTCADAIKLSYNGPINTDLPPVAQILSISPNPGMPNQAVALKGKGTVSSGTVTAYNWRSSIDGNIGTTAVLNKTLTAGTHTIYFKARNSSNLWSPEVSATLDVGRENIYIAQCYGGNEIGNLSMTAVLQSLGATQTGTYEWTYTNPTTGKVFYIHFIRTGAALVSAMARDGAHIIISAHSNYGIGPLFSTSAEDVSKMLTDVRYVDDDRFIKLGTPTVGVSSYGMRTGQAYPYWWPIYKDGKSAIAPYNYGDANGPPAYNYFLTYTIAGDPNHYKVSTVNKSEIQRFSDCGKTPWYSITGAKPDPNKPEHKQYFITNSDKWYPSIESAGTWTQYQDLPDNRANSQYFKENYVTNSAGNGSDYMKFLFTIPQAGQYKVRAWWPALSTNATNAPFTINSPSGNSTLRLDQTKNGRQWNDLGTYTFDPGNYYVKLSDDVSSGNVVADGVQVGHINNPADVVQSDFVAVSAAFPIQINPSGPAPLNVMLVNAGTGDLTGRTWDCGDGFTNTTRDQLTHIYERPGTYSVSLTVTGPMGTSKKTKTNYITVWPTGTTGTDPLRAEFAAYNKFTSQGAATLPLVAMFADISTGDLRKGITYTPPSGFSGTATLTYNVKDTSGNLSTTAAVNINVSNIPTANNDTAVTTPKKSVVINPLSNDKATSGTLMPNSILIAANPAYGTVDVNGILGTITYTPTSQTIERNDSFKYTVADSNGHRSNQATVSIQITNHPVAVDDTVYTKKGTKININVLSNDIAPLAPMMYATVQVNVSPTNGIVEVNHVSGVISYTPSASTFSGTDTFKYSFADANSLVSNQALVTVKVSDAPTANDDTAFTAVGKPVNIDILGNDNAMPDMFGLPGGLDPCTVTIVTQPASGTCVVWRNTWLWNFGDNTTSRLQNPVHMYTQPGNYQISLTITDATGASVTETKPNYIRAVVYEKNIDNVDYPKSSYGGWVGKTMLKTKGMDIQYDQLKYGRMLYESCNSGDYYIQTLSHGLMYYTIATSGGTGSLTYLQLYLQGGKTDKEIWEAMQQTQACYDFYNFNLPPGAGQIQQTEMPASPATPQVLTLNNDQKADIAEMKTLNAEEAFEVLAEPEYVANDRLSETAASQAFANKEYQAVEYSMNKLQSVDEMSDYNAICELKAAKTILSQFPETSIPQILDAYPKTDIISKANLLNAAGKMVCDERIKDLLVKALDNKTETIDINLELVGHPLRICDIAYNQLVLNLQITDVLRTIGTAMSDDIRDYHINVLKSRL